MLEVVYDKKKMVYQNPNHFSYEGESARFDSRKFRLYHQTVKRVAIRILMARFRA